MTDIAKHLHECLDTPLDAFIDAPLVAVDRPDLDTPLSYTNKIINMTDRDVHITGRDGLTHTIKPTYRPSRQAGSVDILYGVTTDESHVKFDSTNQLNAVREFEIPFYEDMRKFLNKQDQLYHGRSTKWSMYRVTIGDIEKAGGSVYVRQLDICISCGDIGDVKSHPYSPVGLEEYHEYNCRAYTEEGTFGYSMRLVDNRGLIDDRYVNMSGTIFRVPVVRDPNVSDGVYITYVGKADDLSNRHTPKTEYYTLEEMSEKCPWVYKSIDDAAHYGDVVARLDADVTLKKLEWEAKSNELKQRQDEWKFSQMREVEEQKREAERLAHQQKLLEQERSNFYESKSYARKDSNEFWKMIPVVLTGFLAVKALWGK